ncbi:unnamed protein product [Heterobilharzia americana]|nr:unnamed protein product [Heterobilharzia americana]
MEFDSNHEDLTCHPEDILNKFKILDLTDEDEELYKNTHEVIDLMKKKIEDDFSTESLLLGSINMKYSRDSSFKDFECLSS